MQTSHMFSKINVTPSQNLSFACQSQTLIHDHRNNNDINSNDNKQLIDKNNSCDSNSNTSGKIWYGSEGRQNVLMADVTWSMK